MLKKLNIGIGALDWSDDETTLVKKFPSAKKAAGKIGVDPSTGIQFQMPDTLEVTGLIPGFDHPWIIELPNGRPSRVLLYLDAPRDDWKPVWDEMNSIIQTIAKEHGFDLFELDIDDPDRAFFWEGILVDFSVQGDTYVLSILPSDEITAPPTAL